MAAIMGKGLYHYGQQCEGIRTEHEREPSNCAAACQHASALLDKVAKVVLLNCIHNLGYN